MSDFSELGKNFRILFPQDIKEYNQIQPFQERFPKCRFEAYSLKIISKKWRKIYEKLYEILLKAPRTLKDSDYLYKDVSEQVKSLITLYESDDSGNVLNEVSNLYDHLELLKRKNIQLFRYLIILLFTS